MSSYREYAPPVDLARQVACTWSSVSRASPLAQAQPIIPDGCADIICFGDEPPHLAAPAAMTEWVKPPQGGATISAIRFRPGGVRAVLRCDVEDLGAGDIDLAAVCGRSAHALHRALLDAATSDARRAVLTVWTRERLAAAPARDVAILAAGDLFARQPWLSVDQVAAQVDLSARQMRRGFIAACGYGPKTLQRIMRLQRALRIAAAPVRLNGLADLACAAGYADQAHMTREFQSLTGFTPGHYLPQHNPELSRWLD